MLVLSFWRLVVIVGVLFTSTASFCRFFHRLLILLFSVSFLALAYRRHCCIVLSSGIVPPYGCFLCLRFLVIVVVVRILLSSLAMSFICRLRLPLSWLRLLALAPRCQSRSLKILDYIRITTHATTMDPQHQAKNVTVAISGVWRLDLVWPSPQNSSYER